MTSLADFAAGLASDLLLCPVRALRLYLLRGQVFVYRSPSPFRVPHGALLALFYERGVVLLGEVIAAAQAARPQVGSLRARLVRSVSTSVAFHRHWSVASFLVQPLGPPVRCFIFIFLATFPHEFDGLLSLGHFVAAGSRIG